MKKIKITHLVLMLFACAVVSFAQIRPLPEVVQARAAWEQAVAQQAYVPDEFVFFRDNIASGGFSYVYGGNSRIFMPEESGHVGEVALVIELDPADYSGGAIVLWGTHYDLREVFPRAALEFWIKGSRGGEVGRVGLADDEMVGGVSTQVSVDFNRFGGIQPFWTHMSIPLSEFGRRGQYWDPRTQSLVNNDFDWGNVKEFIVTTAKAANRHFRIYLDDIRIVPDRFPAVYLEDIVYWDEIVEVIEPSPATPGADVNEVHVLWERDFRHPMTAWTYGGRTVWAQQNTTDTTGENPHVLAVYLDNAEFSGVTFNWGRSMDLTELRESGGGLGFWAQAGPGVTQLFIGLVDDRGNQSVTVSQVANDFGTLDSKWNYIMIPLREFADEGSWWDETINRIRPGNIDWSRIVGMTVSSNRFVNRVLVADPIRVFFSRIALIDNVPGYVDRNIFWDNFVSDTTDMLVYGFEASSPEGWIVITGAGSSAQISIVSQTNRDLRPRFGRWHAALDWSLDDWAMANFLIARRNLPYVGNWSRHSAVAFDIHSSLPNGERMGLVISDQFREDWETSVVVPSGWSTVVVPFRYFRRSFNQPPDARQNRVLDLGNVQEFRFIPREIMQSGRTLLDNIRVTQEPASRQITVTPIDLR